MDTLEIFLESNLNKVDKELDAISTKIGTLASAIGKLTSGNSFSELQKNISKAYDTMSKTPATNGVKKSLEESKKTAQELIAEITNKVKDIKPSVNVDKKSMSALETMAEKYKDRMAEAQSEINKISASSSFANQEKGLERYIIRLEEAKKNLELVNAKMSELSNRDSSHIADIFAREQSSIEANKKSLSEYEAEYRNYKNLVASGRTIYNRDTSGWGNIVEDFKSQYPELQSIAGRYEKLYDMLSNRQYTNYSAFGYDPNAMKVVEEGMDSSITKVKTFQEVLANVKPMTLNTENLYEFNKTMDELYDKFIRLTEQKKKFDDLGVDTESQKYRNVLLELEKVSATLDKYEAKLNEIRSNGSLELKVAPINEGVITSFEGKVNILREKLKNLHILIPSSDYSKILKDIDSIKNKYDSLADSVKNSVANDPNYATTSSFTKQMAKLDELKAKYEELITKKVEMESQNSSFTFNTTALTNLKTIMSSVGNSFKNTMSIMGRFASKVLTTIVPINKLKSAIDKFKISNLSLVKSLSKTVKMLGLMIKRMVLRSLINSVASGFQSLTQYSSLFNSSVSLLWNSIRTLANSVVAMVSPLINALAPALNTVIQYVIKAVNVVNQLISALCGLKTWTKAKQLTDNYGASVEKAGKKVNKALQSFDALNNLTTSENSGSGTSSSDAFETADIDSKWKNLANDIKKAWETGDFYELGKKIGDWLANALESIDWATIKGKARKLARSLATLLNGIMDGVSDSGKKLSTLIGNTVAEAINTAFIFLQEYIRKLNWKRLGEFLAEMLNGAFERLDWTTIKNTLELLAVKIAEAINSFIDTFNWDNISDTISNVVNGIAGTVYLFFSQIKWGELGANLGEQLTKTIEKIDWKMVGNAVGSMIQAFVDLIVNFIKKLDFGTVATAIGDFFKGVAEKCDLGKVAKLLITLLALQLELKVTSLILKSACRMIIEKIAFYLISEGVLASIVSAGATIGGTLCLAILDAVLMYKLGKKIGEAITGDTELYDSFKWMGKGGFFDQIFGNIGEASTVGEKFRTLAEDINTCKDAWYMMRTDIQNNPVISSLATSVSFLLDPLGTLKDSFISLTQTDGWENLKTSSTEAFDSIKNSGMGEYVQGRISDMEKWKNTILITLMYFKEKIGETVTNCKTTFDNAFNWVKNLVKNIILWIVEQVTVKIPDGFKKAFNTAVEWVRGILNDFKTWFDNTWVGQIVSGIGKIASSMSSAKSKSGGGGVTYTTSVQGFATGGFPNKASLFWAGENGTAEMLGTVGGKTAVASGTEITGISDAVYSTGNSQVSLLNSAVSLLNVIANKEFGITESALFSSVQTSASNYYKMTGDKAFS